MQKRTRGIEGKTLRYHLARASAESLEEESGKSVGKLGAGL